MAYDTWDLEVTFTTKRLDDGAPWIMVEETQGPGLPVLGPADFLGLEFKEGVTPTEVEELARLLREKVRCITVTAGARPAGRSEGRYGGG